MEYQGISKLDLKRRNRMQILKVIKECGPISRVDIASALEITRAAVTIITNEMIEEGVLYEVGEAPVSLENLQKGRRKILIDIDSNFKFAVGASISENGVSVGLSNLKPEVLDKNFLDISEETTYEEIVDFIVNETKRMLQNSCLDLSKILGLGISVQPELCSKMKVYFKDGKLDFTNLTETFTKELNMPVVCMNSISALALANQETNIEDRSGNYLFIKFGKNINASILLENEVMHEYLNHTNQIERAICPSLTAKSSMDIQTARLKLSLQETLLLQNMLQYYLRKKRLYYGKLLKETLIISIIKQLLPLPLREKPRYLKF